MIEFICGIAVVALPTIALLGSTALYRKLALEQDETPLINWEQKAMLVAPEPINLDKDVFTVTKACLQANPEAWKYYDHMDYESGLASAGFANCLHSKGVDITQHWMTKSKCAINDDPITQKQYDELMKAWRQAKTLKGLEVLWENRPKKKENPNETYVMSVPTGGGGGSYETKEATVKTVDPFRRTSNGQGCVSHRQSATLYGKQIVDIKEKNGIYYIYNSEGRCLTRRPLDMGPEMFSQVISWLSENK